MADSTSASPSRARARSDVTLYVRDGDAFHKAPTRQISLQAQDLIDQQFHRQCPVLSNPHLVRVFLKIHLGRHDREVFAALFLDSHHRLIEYVELFQGTLDTSEVHPREVIKSGGKELAPVETHHPTHYASDTL